MPDERQYERIVRWLDGRQGHLNADEQAIADEISRDEKVIGNMLNAELPADVRARLQRLMFSELSGRRSRLVKLRYPAVAVAAAAIVFAVILIWNMQERESSIFEASFPPDELLFCVAVNDSDLATLEEQVESLESDFAFLVLPSEDETETEDIQSQPQQLRLNNSTNGFTEG